MTPVDILRYAIAGLALALAATCAGAGVYAVGWDQRIRFAVLFGYSAVTASGQLDHIGNPATWRTYALLPITVAAIIGTAAFLIRNVRCTREDPTRARPASDQCSVLGPGPDARSARDAGDRAGTTGRGDSQ